MNTSPPNQSSLEQQIRNSALASLTRREHCRKELEQKLSRRFAEPQLIDNVLDWLESLQYLDDKRYTEAYVRTCIAKGWGADRVRRELQHKGVAIVLITEVLDASDVDWQQQARELWQRKFRQLPATPKEYAKQMRFLVYRGFSLEQVRDLLKALKQELKEEKV